MATNTKNTAAPELYHYEYSNTAELILSFRGTGTPFSNLQLFNDKNNNGAKDSGENLAGMTIGGNGLWSLNVNVGILASDSNFNFRSIENDSSNVSEITSFTYTPPTTPQATTPLLLVKDQTDISEPPTSSANPTSVTYSLSQGTPNGIVQLKNLGTAQVGSDLTVSSPNLKVISYDESNQTANIQLDAQGKASFTLTTLQDNLTEGNENLIVSATDATNANNIATTSAVTVHDTVPPVVSKLVISPNLSDIWEPDVIENPNQVSYSITGGTPDSLVTLSNTGTAKVGDDLKALPVTFDWISPDFDKQTATIKLNAQGSANFTLAALADNLVENNETVVLKVTDTQNPSNNAVAQSVTLHDKPVSQLQIVRDQSDIFESPGLQDTNKVNYTITGGTPNALVNLINTGTAIIGGTANNGNDARVLPSYLIFSTSNHNNQSASIQLNDKGEASISLIALTDKIIEGNESLIISVSDALNPNNSAGAPIVFINDTPVLNFTESNISVIEGNSGGQSSNQAILTVSLSSPSNETVTVNYATVDGTALAGSDYPANSGIITFAPGDISKTITVPIVGDTFIENDENFSLSLSNSSNNAIIGSTNNTTVTIKNDDTIPTLSFKETSVAINEGNGGNQAAQQTVLTVNLSAAATQPVTVSFQTNPGTATGDGVDYNDATGILTFTPGETSKTINIPIIGDTIVEPDENFSLTLTNPSNNAIIGPTNNATVTIKNDDIIPTLSFKETSVALNEGNGGNQAPQQVVLTVNLSAAATQPVTVSYQSNQGTATGNGADYTDATGILTFAPGETSKTINIPITGDTVVESDENFSVSLTNPSSNAALDSASSAANVTITNDDTPPILTFKTTSVSVQEGNGGTQPANHAALTVELSAPSSQTVTVNYSTADGTAVSGSSTAVQSDYQTSSDILTFAPGETSKIINIPIVGDTFVEANENFFVNLANISSNALLGSANSATVTITNDDLPVVSFKNGTISVAEGDGGSQPSNNAIVSVNLSTSSNQTVTVDFATSDGTAISSPQVSPEITIPADYQPTSGTLTFAPGETSKNISVAIIGDTLEESNENFFITLTGVSTNATLGSPNNATVTITNDDFTIA